ERVLAVLFRKYFSGIFIDSPASMDAAKCMTPSMLCSRTTLLRGSRLLKSPRTKSPRWGRHAHVHCSDCHRQQLLCWHRSTRPRPRCRCTRLLLSPGSSNLSAPLDRPGLCALRGLADVDRRRDAGFLPVRLCNTSLEGGRAVGTNQVYRTSAKPAAGHASAI